MSIFPTLWYVGAHDMGVSRYDHSTVTAGTQLYLLGGYDETHTLQVGPVSWHTGKAYVYVGATVGNPFTVITIAILSR